MSEQIHIRVKTGPSTSGLWTKYYPQRRWLGFLWISYSQWFCNLREAKEYLHRRVEDWRTLKEPIKRQVVYTETFTR